MTSATQARRALPSVFCCAAILTLAAARDGHGQTVTPPPAEAALRGAALDQLLAERDSPKAFAAAIDNARKHGVSEQAILEARFLYHVDQREDAAIAALLPEFLARRDSFRLADSVIFSFQEDWLAVIEYVRAIAALQKGDKASFKSHITEAFWLSPRQAAAFAPHIERLRLDDALRNLKTDFTLPLKDLNGGDGTSLAALKTPAKALVLHFWSPWSPQCDATLPVFARAANSLLSHGIAVASLVAAEPPELAAEARTVSGPLEKTACGRWLIDDKEQPYARLLRVQNHPTVVVFSNENTVLFHGNPESDEFWEALAKIDPAIKRTRDEPLRTDDE